MPRHSIDQVVSDSITRVAVIGIGAMGARVARRLLDAGYDVVVWNRTPGKTEPLVRAGAHGAASPAEASRRADAVITTVADPAALEDVTHGETGIAGGARPGSIVLEMSTVGPAAVARLAGALPDSVQALDAPVLGSLSEVEAGTLRIFVGGPAEAVERCKPLLSVLGTPVHVGELGSGAAAKLVANTTLLGVLGLLGEAIALARGLGLPTDVTFDVLSTTPLAAQAKRRRPALESGTFPLRFTLSLGHKDSLLIVDTAQQAGIDLRLAQSVRTWLADAEAAGLGGEDYSAVVAYIAANS